MSTRGENPPGVKRVTWPDGTVYLYAWRGRGAPRLYAAEGSEELWREWRQALIDWNRPVEHAGGNVSAWLTRWRSSLEFAAFRPNTQRAYERHIGRIRAKFGRADPRAFTEPAMRAHVLDWRDTMRDRPAMADKTVDGLKTFLGWLQDRGVIGAHVCARIKRISGGDRSDCIWTPAHLALFRARAPQELVRVMEVARLTALSAAELVRLEWDHVDVDEIAITREKTGELALVPVLPELRSVLAAIPRAHARVLVHSRGGPYTARSLSARFCTVTRAIGMPERTLHDLRRTTATELCAAGLDDREVAEILGWGTQDVAKIRRRYVGREVIVRAAIERLKDHRERRARYERGAGVEALRRDVKSPRRVAKAVKTENVEA